MNESSREIYGIRVDCAADPRAIRVVDAFFGPPSPPRGAGAPSLRLVVRVVDEAAAPTVEPPHTEEVIAADPIVVDTGGSRCVFDPAAGTATVDLCAADLDDPIVWGRWILERLALYLVCRSPRLYPLHAGAFVTGGSAGGHAVLVSGPTGMGKSTFTHAAVRRGAHLVGEDIMVRDRYDEVPGRVWGYPRALYLSADRLAGSDALAGAVTAPVDGGGKFRVSVPGSLAPRLRPSIVPTAVVFLARGGATVEPLSVEPLSVDEAVERCRDDVATGKAGESTLAAIEADLRGLLKDRPVLQLAMSADLDASYDALLATLAANRPGL
jgi:hypothetical protein